MAKKTKQSAADQAAQQAIIKAFKKLPLWLQIVIVAVIAIGLLVSQNGGADSQVALNSANKMEVVPAYEGELYTIVGDNEPTFTAEELAVEAFEYYAPLDALGRCGAAEACLGQELMPTEERGSISSVYPSGWEQAFYDFVPGEAVYNRSHLIGFQLTGENANEQNLITGTRYMNADGMEPLESMVADYIRATGNHVRYRVTPVFEGQELVARGVWMEALSIEDEGAGICFSVYVHNVQPGVEIDYATGQTWAAEENAA